MNRKNVLLAVLIVLLLARTTGWGAVLTVEVRDHTTKKPIREAFFQFYSIVEEKGEPMFYEKKPTDERGIITYTDVDTNRTIYWTCKHRAYHKEFDTFTLSNPLADTLRIWLVDTTGQQPDIMSLLQKQELTRIPQIIVETRIPALEIQPTQIAIETVVVETKIKEGKSTLEVVGYFAFAAIAFTIFVSTVK